MSKFSISVPRSLLSFTIQSLTVEPRCWFIAIYIFPYNCLCLCIWAIWHTFGWWQMWNQSLNQQINLSFRPLALFTRLSCWPLQLIFFKIKLLFVLPSFNFIFCASSQLSFHTISLSSLSQLSSCPHPIRWHVLSVAEGDCSVFPRPLLECSPHLFWLGQLPWPPRDPLAPLCRDLTSYNLKGHHVPSLRALTHTLFILTQSKFWPHLFLDPVLKF